MSIVKFGTASKEACIGNPPNLFRGTAVSRIFPDENKRRDVEDGITHPPLTTNLISVYLRIDGDRSSAPYLIVIQRKDEQVICTGNSVEDAFAKVALYGTDPV